MELRNRFSEFHGTEGREFHRANKVKQEIRDGSYASTADAAIGKMEEILLTFFEQRIVAVFLANAWPKENGVYHPTTLPEH